MAGKTLDFFVFEIISIFLRHKAYKTTQIRTFWNSPPPQQDVSKNTTDFSSWEKKILRKYGLEGGLVKVNQFDFVIPNSVMFKI